MTETPAPPDAPRGPTGPAGDDRTEAPPHGAAPTATPPADGPPVGGRPAFWRSSTDRVAGGVAGGVARSLGMDAVVVRIITVVLAIAFPPTVVAYLAAWLVVARDDQPASTLGSRASNASVAIREPGGIGFWIGVVVLVGLGVAAFEADGGLGLLPLLLIGIGVALWSRDGSGGATAAWPGADATTTPAVPPTDAPTSAGPGRDRPGGVATAGSGGATAAGPRPPAPPVPPTRQQPQQEPSPPEPPRPRSPLGAITIAVALIVTGVVAALDMVTGVPLDADPSHLAAVALLVLGLGQLVGALWGRARWLSLVALLLLPPVMVGAAIREVEPRFPIADGLDFGDGIGERTYDPGGADALPDDIRLLAGSIRVDLEDWRPPTTGTLEDLELETTDLTVSVGAGEVVLTTPRSVPWRVVADVGLGDTSVTRNAELLERRSSEDLDQSLEVVRTGGPQDGPVLDIVVDLRLGEFDLHTPPFDLAAWSAVQAGEVGPRTDGPPPSGGDLGTASTSTSTTSKELS